MNEEILTTLVLTVLPLAGTLIIGFIEELIKCIVKRYKQNKK